MSFLAGLPSEFDIFRSQIPSIMRFLHCRILSAGYYIHIVLHMSKEVVYWLVKMSYELVKQQAKTSGSRVEPQGPSSAGDVFYYCRKLRHTRWDYRKLQNQNRRFQFTHVAFASDTLEQSIALLVDEYTKFSRYQKSLNYASTPITTLVESGKRNTCLISSSPRQVITSKATNLMKGNSNSSTTFQSYPSTSVDPSRWVNIICSQVRHSPSSPLIPLTFAVSSPRFSFNSIFMSRLTLSLNCNIAFFLDYCLFQGLFTKWVISRR